LPTARRNETVSKLEQIFMSGVRESMAQPIAPDYGQQFLFTPVLEDWVSADHPARFLREFVDQLDLMALGFAMPVAAEGRPIIRACS
jgi:hypothetical protein